MIGMSDDGLLTALRHHWAASDANDFDEEHRIYRDDAVLEYPQSGERLRGRKSDYSDARGCCEQGRAHGTTLLSATA